MSDDRLVPLAEITKPHGVRGEVRLKVYNVDSDLLLEVDEVVADFPDGGRDVLKITSARRVPDGILARFEGTNDRDEADELRGVRLSLPRSAFPPPEEGEFYACDVEGAKVVAPDGEVGTVERLISYPTCDALIVVTTKGRAEIALVEGVVEEIDTDAHVVRIASRDALEPA